MKQLVQFSLKRGETFQSHLIEATNFKGRRPSTLGGTMKYFISVRGVVSGQILLALILKGKQKKGHQNRIVINEMAVISVSTKVPFL